MVVSFLPRDYIIMHSHVFVNIRIMQVVLKNSCMHSFERLQLRTTMVVVYRRTGNFHGHEVFAIFASGPSAKEKFTKFNFT